MTELLPLDPDQLLTTTRSVRKRLDYERQVPLEIVTECLEISQQAPSASNTQKWHWIVLTDVAKKQAVADFYARAFVPYAASKATDNDPTATRVRSSAQYLADTMAQAPVLVIGAIDAGGALAQGNQAAIWGSLLPAAWSFALALRARGLGSAWTTLHLTYEREVAELLGIPDGVHQGVLLPVAYTKGTDFKPAPRHDFDDIVHINEW